MSSMTNSGSDVGLGEEGVDGCVFGAEDGEGLGSGEAEVDAAEVHVEGPDEVRVRREGDGFAGEGYGFVPGSLMVTWKLGRAGMEYSRT